MKTNSDQIITYVMLLLFAIYILLDSMHYFSYRLNPDYPTYTEAFYEWHLITYIKWVLCFLGILGAYLNLKKRSISFYVLITVSILIILIFVFNGQFSNLMIGSVVFEYGLLEVLAVFVIIYSLIYLRKKYSISLFKTLSLIMITGILFYFFIAPLPTVIEYQ